MLSQTLPDFGEWSMTILRVVACVGGALVSWLLCDPLTRLGYRICFRDATPGWLLPWTKLTGAVTAAALIWLYLPLGGSGGFGWGPGLGSGPGKGPGQGNGTIISTDGANKEKTTTNAAKQTLDSTSRELVAIEILGGSRFKDDGKNRYYLLKRNGETLSYAELKDYFEKHRSKIKVEIEQTDESAMFNSPEDPTRRLQKLANDNDIYTLMKTPRD